MLIYLASPYSHPEALVRQARYKAVETFVGQYYHGAATVDAEIFSPILYFHNVALHHSLPGDADFWWFTNRAFMRKSDLLLLYKLDGWEESKGMKMEIEYANEHNLPTIGLTPKADNSLPWEVRDILRSACRKHDPALARTVGPDVA